MNLALKWFGSLTNQSSRHGLDTHKFMLTGEMIDGGRGPTRLRQKYRLLISDLEYSYTR